jgi:three-Cys-motif partner protein
VAPSDDFHAKPFDEGTLTKLQILELYAREWLPVFLAPTQTKFTSIHVFDFFAGPGTDSVGVPGSPIRLIKQIDSMRSLPGWGNVTVHAHFSDTEAKKILALKKRIDELGNQVRDVVLDIEPLPFEAAFERSKSILKNPRAAKLLLIDQCGVSHVTPSVFDDLVKAPACDFLFFISSSTLNRFRDHPAIKQKINRPDDPYHVHRAAVDYYRGQLPKGSPYYLAPFSIKKGPNVYGLIFGSGHPLGMDKFLQVAWKEDEISGEADFDIHRDNIQKHQPRLDFGAPTKLWIFERDLEDLIRQKLVKDERDVIRVCFKHGVKRQHATRVLAALKKEGVIDITWRVPDIRQIDEPRKIKFGNS